jgi:hypothetical protein
MRTANFAWLLIGLTGFLSAEESNDFGSKPLQKGFKATCGTLDEDPITACTYSFGFFTEGESSSYEMAIVNVGTTKKFLPFFIDGQTPYYYNFEVTSGDEIVLEYNPEKVRYWAKLFDEPNGSGNVITDSTAADFVVINQCLSQCSYALVKENQVDWELFTMTVSVNGQIVGVYNGSEDPLVFSVKRGDSIYFATEGRHRRDLDVTVHDQASGQLILTWIVNSYYSPLLASNPCTIAKSIGFCTYSFSISSKNSTPYTALVDIIVNGQGSSFSMSYDPSSSASYYNFGVVSNDQIVISFEPNKSDALSGYTVHSQTNGQGTVVISSDEAWFPIINPCQGSCTYSIIRTVSVGNWARSEILIYVNRVRVAVYNGEYDPVEFNVLKGDTIFYLANGAGEAAAEITDSSDNSVILTWVYNAYHSPLIAFNQCQSEYSASPFGGRLYPILPSQIAAFLQAIAAAESTKWLTFIEQ